MFRNPITWLFVVIMLVLVVAVWHTVGRLPRQPVSPTPASTTVGSTKLPDQVSVFPTDPVRGAPAAAVTIVEFGDFECPFCRQSYPIIRTLAQEFKDEVRVVYRDFPLETIHPKARFAAAAGYCAEEQDLFWPLHDKLFQNQEDLSQAAIAGYANQIGADARAFAACVSSQAAQDEVSADIADGEAAGALGTPTWFINGIRVAGVIPEDVFRQIIIDLME